MVIADHPLITALKAQGFAALGWFVPRPADKVPDGLAGPARFCLLVGNAGPAMFDRFTAECDETCDSLDEWTMTVLEPLAAILEARAVYPFTKPALPFLSWAQAANAGEKSPLGLNLHPVYGLWHGFRAAFIFSCEHHIPAPTQKRLTCSDCKDKPCLHTCPVAAFNGRNYDVPACVSHLKTPFSPCLEQGCRARLACPLARNYSYSEQQNRFHITRFLGARTE